MLKPWERICFAEEDGSGAGDPPREPPREPPRRDPPRDPPRRAAHEDDDPPPRETPTRRQTESDLRAEAASWRVALRRAEQERDDLRADLEAARSSTERVKTEAVAPLQAKFEKARDQFRKAAITHELVAMGLQDADLALIIDKTPDAPKVEVDDDFNVKGARELAEAFKKWKPDYFKAAKTEDSGNPKDPPKREPPKRQTSAGGEPAGGQEPPQVDVKAMKPAEYAAWKQQMMRSMRTLGGVSR